MDNLQRKKRGANITNEQKTLLIEYMNKHPELVKGKLTSSFTLKDSVRLWNEISEILNSANGAKKDWKDWRKCWHDIQSRSKKKYSIIKQSRAATGGGEQNTEVLTEHEEQVLNTMYSTSIEGHPDIEESIINILSDTEDDAMQVEYLEEYEDVLNFTEKKQDKIEIQKKQIATCTHSDNNRNMLFLQKNKATINSNKLSNNKENINKNNNVEKQPSFEISKALGKSMNTSSCEQNKTTTEKKRMTKRELLNTVEVSTNLNSIYEQTYELKKQYYEARLEYLKRSVETQEKMATILEKCNENLINITDKCNMS